MILRLIFISILLSANVLARLVVDTKDQLMIIDDEGKESLDLMRILQEGDKVNATVTESDCSGVMQETAEYEFMVMNGKEESHIVEITRVLDSVSLHTVFNHAYPWVVGQVKIR